jgi:hypothetical protein
VFHEVQSSFAPVPEDDYKLVSRINTFRNDYIAQQNKELTDSAVAETALGEWVSDLRRIWKLYG